MHVTRQQQVPWTQHPAWRVLAVMALLVIAAQALALGVALAGPAGTGCPPPPASSSRH